MFRLALPAWTFADQEALPAFLGEADDKSLLLQPGVSLIGEGATGINVRDEKRPKPFWDEGFILMLHALGFFQHRSSRIWIREATPL